MQFSSQMTEGAMEVAFYASRSKPQDVGRFPNRKAVHVHEDEDFTLPLGKLIERFVDSNPEQGVGLTFRCRIFGINFHRV